MKNIKPIYRLILEHVLKDETRNLKKLREHMDDREMELVHALSHIWLHDAESYHIEYVWASCPYPFPARVDLSKEKVRRYKIVISKIDVLDIIAESVIDNRR